VAAHRAPVEVIAASAPQTAVLTETLIFTIMEASLAALVLNMYLFGVRSNAVYQMRSTPVLIGVAGDSGAGKDTFAELVARALGRDRTTVIRVTTITDGARGRDGRCTHLDVRGNELHQQHEYHRPLARALGRQGRMTTPRAASPNRSS
jgi:adenylylsulfate kinase-like enzyme